MTISDGNPSWARGWEQMSAERSPARQIAGWKAGTTGSVLHPEKYQSLAGPWIDGVDPADVAKAGS